VGLVWYVGKKDLGEIQNFWIVGHWECKTFMERDV